MMSFNSPTFFVLLVLTSTIYFFLPIKNRWVILLLSSLIFYGYLVPSIYFLVPIILILISFIASIKVERAKGKLRKFYFLVCIGIVLLVLLFFKYFGRVDSTMPLLVPIGLSFYTFQILGYVIEVYRQKQSAEKNLFVYTLFVLFFPQILAGPIQRPQQLLPQIHKPRVFDYQQFGDGLKLILWGLFKKLVIADRLAIMTGEVFRNYQVYNGFPLILAVIGFTYQLYCDFSGYSDIAIGSAKVFGFELTPNFNRPYASSSLTEFWRRWHMSLSNWIKDYLYTPLVLSTRNWGKPGIILSLLVAFILIGFWHGMSWNFGVFGLIQGLFISLEFLTKPLRKKIVFAKSIQRYLGTIYTLCVWSLSLVFFNSNNVSDAVYIIRHSFVSLDQLFIAIVTFNGADITILSSQNGLGLTSTELGICFVAIIFMEYIQYKQQTLRFEHWVNKLTTFWRWVFYYVLIWSIILFGKFGINQFIYFQF